MPVVTTAPPCFPLEQTEAVESSSLIGSSVCGEVGAPFKPSRNQRRYVSQRYDVTLHTTLDDKIQFKPKEVLGGFFPGYLHCKAVDFLI